MHSERSQLHYTCVFLQVSFQAIKNALPTAAAERTIPCWLDAETLKMLLRELKRSRQAAAPFDDVHASLDAATYHCGLLMAQCPGALDQALCHYHLDAVIAPLKESVIRLAGSKRPDASVRGRFRPWLRR